MPFAPGAHQLGPDNAELLVHTGRSGVVAKAGHDLVIEVESWSATLNIAEQLAGSSVELRADTGSLRVRAGTGGIQPLGEDDKAGIKQTIDDEVLKRSAVQFRSTDVECDEERMLVRGELELLGMTRPVGFELNLAPDGKLTGRATIKQTEWGIKPYSALFGTLKVADEVVVTIEGVLTG
jgi:polyisoprenoid-binding protein YceI